MKKIVVVLSFMLFVFSAAVSAQITIAGQNFSMLVVIPLILMAVFMLIFGIVIVIDRYREKKERGVLKKETEDENHRYGIMEKIKEKVKEMEEKKPEKKEKEKKAEAIVEEYKSLADYLDDIRDLKKKFKKLNDDDAFKQLVALIRNFFSDYLGIDYEFTFDELEKELREKNKEVVFFSKNLSDMSYNAEGIPKNKVAKLLDEFEDVAEKIILKEEIAIETYGKKEEASVKPELKKIELKEVKKKEEAKKTEYMDEEKKNRIIELIREGRIYIKRDINKANDIYEEVYVLYNQLPKNKMKELRQKIMDFYDAIRMELKS